MAPKKNTATPTLPTTVEQLEAMIAAGIAKHEAAKAGSNNVSEESGGAGGAGITVGRVTRSRAATGTGGAGTGGTEEVQIPFTGSGRAELPITPRTIPDEVVLVAGGPEGTIVAANPEPRVFPLFTNPRPRVTPIPVNSGPRVTAVPASSVLGGSENDRIRLMDSSRTVGCTYKNFRDCKPKEFLGTEGAVGYIRWAAGMEAPIRMSGCTDEQIVTFVSGVLIEDAQAWWQNVVDSMGVREAYALSWEAFKLKMREKFCPRIEIQQIEAELNNLKMVGSDYVAFINRFYDLCRLVPHLVTPEYLRTEKFIDACPDQIRESLLASKPATTESAVQLTAQLVRNAVKTGTMPKMGAPVKDVETEEKETTEDQKGKRKYSNFKKQGQSSNSNAGQMYATVTDDRQKSQKCDKCGFYHKEGSCEQARCERCQKMGHQAKRCRGQLVDTRVCYGCNEPGHMKKNCPKEANVNI